MSNNIQRKKIAAGKTGDNNGIEVFQGFDDDNIYYKTRKGGLVQLVDLETAQGLVGANNELSEILANGSTTSGQNITITSGDYIYLAGANARITGSVAGDMFHESDRGMTVRTLAGTESILFKPGSAEIVVSPSGVGSATLDFSAMTLGRSIAFQDASGTVALTSDISGGFTLDDATDIITGTTTGTKFGTSPIQKLAFWGNTPTTQPATITQTYSTTTGTHAARTASTLTDSTGGTADTTVAAISGSGADADINNNFADIIAQVNNLKSDSENTAQVLNNLIDKLQAIGIVA
jgi:hypothetical protein